jgi:type I restriction enzyme R subunit
MLTKGNKLKELYHRGYAPFSQEGGLGKVYQLFGDELNDILDELNEALAA